VSPTLSRPGSDELVDLAEHPLEAGLIRLALHGGDGFELRFDHPDVLSAAAACLAPAGTDDVWDAEAIRPYAERGLRALEAAAEGDVRLRRLLGVWRPRALRLAGLADEAGGEDRLRLRLEDRLASLAAQLQAAQAAGDDDLAQALHARYIELGTTYAGRLARTW
jgi:hypothetical protein